MHIFRWRQRGRPGGSAAYFRQNLPAGPRELLARLLRYGRAAAKTAAAKTAAELAELVARCAHLLERVTLHPIFRFTQRVGKTAEQRARTARNSSRPVPCCAGCSPQPD